MPTEQKSARELEKLVLAEALKQMECEGATGVRVVGLEDERVDYNWYVSVAHNATPMCQETINAIVAQLQKRYDFSVD